MSSARWLPSLLVLLLPAPLGSGGSKLSAPRVLLPFSREVQAGFRLRAGDGCYSWYSTRPDVITVTPEYINDTSCSQMALLSARSLLPIRLRSVVIAEEHETGHLMRCVVIVGLIHTIEIISRSRELYVEDSTLELAVRAKDLEGNTFSSLSGVTFDWSAVKDETEDFEPSNKIRILKYSETEYSPPDYITEMEEEHRQGDLILVSGMRTGAGVIKVRVKEAIYKDVTPANVRLFVLENIFLMPSVDIYLLVGSYIKYTVSRLMQGQLTEMELPLENYDLLLQEHVVAPGGSPGLPVAKLDINTVTVTALQLGHVSLVLLHKNIHMRGTRGLPNCTIHVVDVAYLGFSIYPGERWVLEVYKEYEITVEVFEKLYGNKVYFSDNLRILLELPVELLEVKASSINGSYYQVSVCKSGMFIIKAEFTGVFQQDNNLWRLPNPIAHIQEVKSFYPIVLTPTFLAFPHHAPEVSYYSQIQVEGGSGNFTWMSSNHSVAVVTREGLIKTAGVLGKCVVQARDVLNPYHYGEVKVYVMKLCRMEIMPVQADVEVSQSLDVPIVMYGMDPETREILTLTNCSFVVLEVIMEKQGVFSLIKGQHRPCPDSCSSVQLRAECTGHTLVTVFSLLCDDYFDSSATFAAYKPLKAVDPVETALVTLHSVKEIVFEGGPEPWVLKPSCFFLELQAEDENLVSMQQVWPPRKRKRSQYIYRVLCLAMGEQVLFFRVGNQPEVLNPSPAVEMVLVVFICTLPTSLSVYPLYTVASGADPCPLPQHSKQLVAVSSSHNTILELAVFDQYGRKFDNFSSLRLEWKSSNETLADFPNTEAMQMVAKDDGTGQKRLHGHRGLQVHQLKGTVLITVSPVGYKDGIIPINTSTLLMSAAVELLLVEEVSIVPPEAILFNHQDVMETIYLADGSGHFFVNVSDANIITVIYQEAENSIQVIPVNPGIVTIAVYDLCLTSRGPVFAHVSVSNVYQLDLDLIDKIEVGKMVPVTLRVLDGSKKPFPNKYFKYMDIRLQAASPIITLTAVDAMDTFCASFLLRAVAIGQTTLIATAQERTGRRLASVPRQVEVFGPFQLVPHHMTLIPQNMMQVLSQGGPQLQSIIHFSIDNKTVATVNGLGQVMALEIGVAVVLGTIQAINEDTGKVNIFCQDSVEVEVVQLRAVRIHAPATRLITGTKMPVYVMGMTSTQTPFSFNNAIPQLEFHWSMNKRDILDLVGRYEEVRLSLQPEYSFSVLVHTKTAGATALKVIVHCQNVSANQFEGNVGELSDEVQILVFEKLQLFSPALVTEQILLSPSSQLKLYTNRDAVAVVRSQVIQWFPNPSIIKEDGRGLLNAGATTGTAVLEVTSQENFGLKQTVIIGVRVAPISYLRISTSPVLRTVSRGKLTAFPLGMILTFTVHFHDRMGEEFHAHNMRLHLATNRDDLLQIVPGKTNFTYVAQALNPGVTLLGIWDEKHPGLADYIPIPVEHAISLNVLEPIAIGDVVCFNAPLVNNDGQTGLWAISSGNILEVDSMSGAAVAKSAGTATIFYNISRTVKTYREVVVNSSRLVLTMSPRTYLTTAPNSGETQLLIATGYRGESIWGPCSPLQEQAIVSVLRPESHLSCTVSFTSHRLDIPASTIFHVEPQYNTEKGMYVCVIKTRIQSDNMFQDLSTTDTLVSLKASLINAQGVPETERVEIPFFPAFYNNQTEMMFSSEHLINEIRVMGVREVLKQIKVIADSPGLAVSSRSASSSVPGMDIYKVTAVNLRSLQDTKALIFINISCPLTGQIVPLTVKALRKPYEIDPSSGNGYEQLLLISTYQVLFFTLFVGLTTAAAIVIIAHHILQNRVLTVPVFYVPTAPGYTHGRDSVSTLQQRSTTPQKHLWSER